MSPKIVCINFKTDCGSNFNIYTLHFVVIIIIIIIIIIIVTITILM